MITCKEDLIGKFAERDDKGVFELFIGKCKEYGVTWGSGASIHSNTEGEAVGCDKHGLGYASSHFYSEENYTQLTLADFKPSPAKTKVEYVKCDESLNDIAKAMIDGETLYCATGDVIYKWVNGSFDDQYGDTFIVAGGFYRRVETEVTWRDELITTFGDRVSSSVRHDFVQINGQIGEDRFIAMCHLVASLTDKPNEM